MSVTAFALTGYKLEGSAIGGALNFTVTNSLGGFMMLAGIGLIYSRAGALDFSSLAQHVAASPNDPVIEAAFCMIVCALLIKSAMVPFHFWLCRRACGRALARLHHLLRLDGVDRPVRRRQADGGGLRRLRRCHQRRAHRDPRLRRARRAGRWPDGADAAPREAHARLLDHLARRHHARGNLGADERGHPPACSSTSSATGW